jgi:putative membrane protein
MLLAQTAADWAQFWFNAFAALIFGALGIALLLLGYFGFDFFARKIDVQAELNRGNVAVAIVVAALLLSLAFIVTHVVR